MEQLEVYEIRPNEKFSVMLGDARRSDDLTFREFFNALFVYDPDEVIPHKETLANGTSVNSARSAGQNMGAYTG